MATKRPGRAGSDVTKKEISVEDLLDKNFDSKVFEGLDDSTLKDLFLKARETLSVGGFTVDYPSDKLVRNMKKMGDIIIERPSFEDSDPDFFGEVFDWEMRLESRGHIRIEGTEGIAETSAETTETTGETSGATGETSGETTEATGETSEETTEATGETSGVTGETSGATGETTEETPEAPGETTGETSGATGETSGATGETTEASDDSKKGKVKKGFKIAGGVLTLFTFLGLGHYVVKDLVLKNAGQDVGEQPSITQPVDPQLPEGSHFDFTQEQNTAIHDLLVSEGLIKSSTQILGVKEVVCEEDKTTMYFKTVIDGKDGVISMPIAQNYTALEALAYADKNSIETKGFAMTLVEKAVAYKDENGQVQKFVSVADMPALSDYLAGQTKDSTVGAGDVYVSVGKTTNLTNHHDCGNLSALVFGDGTVYLFDDFASFETNKTNNSEPTSEDYIIRVANMAAGGVIVPYSGQFDFNEIEISKLIALGVNANVEAATQTTTSASSSLELSR